MREPQRRAANAFRVHVIALVAAIAVLQPAHHADFGHYTFALPWLPGMCNAKGGGCTAAQPHSTLVGLHGLWPSEPRTLIARGVAVQTWWARGCDLYGVARGAPPISAALGAAVRAVMPHFTYDLLAHEYDKHVRCFGFDPARFFRTELAMRDRVASSAFAAWLVARQGRRVTRTSVSDAFDAAFATRSRTSLQLRCERDVAGRPILTQLWITVRASALGRFPQGDALANAVQNQTSCPNAFVIPGWTSP